MRKKLLIFVPLFFLILAVSGFLYAKSQLPKVPEMTRHALESQGISLTYSGFVKSEKGLGISLQNVSLSGKALPVAIKAKTASLGIAMKGWPLFQCFLVVSDPVVEMRESVTADKATASKPAGEFPKFAGIIAPLFEFDLKIENASSNEWSGLFLEAQAKQLAIKNGGISLSSIQHDFRLAVVNTLPWLPAVHWRGKSSFSGGSIEATGHHVNLEAVEISIDGKFSVPTKKWTAELSIPQGLKVSARGTEAQYQLEGKANIKDLELTVNNPSAKGKLRIDLNAEFSKAANLKLNGRGSIDATQMEINQEKKFQKPAGVPLSASFTAEGTDSTLKFPQIEARLSNLIATSSGEIGLEEPRLSKVSFHIAPTELSGWERFFPEYRNVQTQGTLQLDGNYEGPAQDWRSAVIALALKARGIHMPILSEWVRKEGLVLQGMARIDSDTNLSLTKGALKTVATNSRIDLRDAHLKYGSALDKPRGIPFLTEVQIQSTDRRAEIKKGEISLGPLRTRMKGSIENFTRPFIRMKFDLDKFEVARALALSPGTRFNGISDLAGSIAVSGRVEGPLTDKNQLPKVDGIANLSHLAFQYELESTKKKIKLRDLSGPLQFTNTSLGSRGLRAVFPNSDATIAFQMRDFDAPQTSFNLQSQRFALADFFDIPKESQGAGVVPIPVSSKKAEDDFRKNPLLRNARAHGTLSAKNIDLGYTQIDSMQGNLSYDRLLLKVDPLTLKVFDGTVQTALIWDGRSQIPSTQETINVQGVNANRFISSYSEKAKDVLEGRLSAHINLRFSGMSAEEIKKSAVGTGDFQLAAATFKTMRFTQKPMESLRKVPLISKYITKTDWNEKFNDVNGKFSIRDQSIQFTNLIFRAGIFDVVSPETSVNFDANMKGMAFWYPKGSLLPADVSDMIRDEKGVPSLPIALDGPIKSPAVTPDTSVLESRFKAYLGRKANAEKDRAVSAVKEKAGKQVQDALKKSLGNIFK